MKAFLPLSITDARLTSTSVVELAPALYAGGTTYTTGATAGVAGAAGLITVYRSLQSSNTGHDPEASPLWWTNIGTTYGVYDVGATYATGDRVIDSVNHLVYQSLIDSNTGNALTDTDSWYEVGPTNVRAMFTYDHTLATTVPSPLTWTYTPGERVNAMQFAGVTATSIDILATSVTGGGVVFERTISMRSHQALGWWRWLFGAFRYRRTAALYDLPPYRDLVITVTITNGDANVVLGKWGVGTSVYLGVTTRPVATKKLRASLIQRDQFNELRMTKRRSVPEAAQILWAEKRYFTSIDEFSEASDAEPVFWSALEESADLYNDALSFIGIARTFDVELHADQVRVTLDTEGL